jgi:plastocyanin
VTWTNIGTTVHTVKSDPGYPDQFDSGGIAPTQSYSHKFQNPGTYGYHSTTEVNYAVDQFGVTIPQWLLTGTILVQ